MDAIFVNTTLSGIQQRNLEVSSCANSVFFLFLADGEIHFQYCCFEWQRVLGKPVLDRVGLIIEIFNAHACTKEGKLQVSSQYLVKELVC